jgi:aminoglycoside/choline kinase family phosphotransferase
MYSTVIPSLIALCQGDPLTTFPTIYHTSDNLIVLGNLTSQGYRTGDHVAGLDVAHCKLVFAELGRFHAAFSALKNSDSTDTVKALNEASAEIQFTQERRSIYDEDFAQLARKTISIIRQTPETCRYAKRVENILSDTYSHLLNFLKPRELFSTLTHGDLWTNNIMFSYSEDEPVAVKFLDFQTCRYGSPALDINYFLYTSTTAEVRGQYMDDFMRTYHRSLVRTLRHLGLNSSMNLTDLRREVDSMSLYGFLAAHLNLRDMFSDRNIEGDADDLFSRRIAEIVMDLGEQRVF